MSESVGENSCIFSLIRQQMLVITMFCGLEPK